MSLLVGIDIGSHKICTLVGEALPGGGVRIHGIGHAPAEGIRGGEVVHVEDAAGAIAASVERAERVAGIGIDRATIGLTGLHIDSRSNHATVPLGRRPRAAEAADVNRVLEAAGAVPMEPGREVLHVLPTCFTLDERSAVVSPLGMEGHRLDADVHIVTASSAALANLRRCLKMAELLPEALVFSTLAGAEATLTPDERQLGAFVLDLGASETGLACYRDNATLHCATLPIGGRHLTNDLAVLLQTPLEQAERIKTTFGHVLPEYDTEAVLIDIQPFGEGEARQTTRHHVSEVLAARIDELASLVEAELGAEDLMERLPAGAILTGGGTELKGLARRLHDRWNLPVRVGRPREVIGLGDTARGPSHASPVGLLLWQARRIPDAVGLYTPPEDERGGAQGNLGRAVGWARSAFLPGNDRGGRR
ncbi:MAG: cell division protein FtsA [Chloroflexi bacterium]|nr:cell division protein FtsA [Chloroflexota bacterium]